MERTKESFCGMAEPHRHWFLGRFGRNRRRIQRPADPVLSGLPHSVRFGYAMGHVLNDLCASMWFTYSLVFYTAVIGLSHTMAGVLMIIGQIADAIGTPIVGALSDRCQRNTDIGVKRNRLVLFFKNRKSFYIVGTVLIVCTKPFMMSPCFPCSDRTPADRNSTSGSSGHSSNNDLIVKIAYFSAFIVFFQWGWAAVQTVHLAIAADLTPYDSERTFLLSLRNTMTAVCNSLTYVGQWVSVTLFDQKHQERPMGPGDAINFQIVVLSIVVLGTVTSTVFVTLVPGADRQLGTVSLESSSALSQSSSPRRHHSIRNILGRWKLHYIGFLYMTTRIFVVSGQSLLTLYLHESLGCYAYELASIPLMMNIVCFGASLAISPFTKIAGRKAVFVAGTAIGLGASVWTYFDSSHSYRHGLVYVVASMYGAAGAFLQVTALALVAEFIGEDIKDGAFIYGYMSFLDKVATGLLLALILHFHDTQTAGPGVSKNNTYFTLALAVSCSLSSVVGCLAIMFLRSPSSSAPVTASLQDVANDKRLQPGKR